MHLRPESYFWLVYRMLLQLHALFPFPWGDYKPLVALITGATGTVAAGLVPLCVEKLVEEEAIEIQVSLVLFFIHKEP